MQSATAIFEVQNVKCGGCAANIENALRALPGVEDVQVDVPTGTVTVSASVARKQLAQVLAVAGYPEKT